MAKTLNLSMDQGANFSNTIPILNGNNDVVDLTGYTAQSQMKRTYAANTSYTFTTSISNTDGLITLSMTANATANIADGRYVYDVDIINSSNAITRVIEGVVIVNPRATVPT